MRLPFTVKIVLVFNFYFGYYNRSNQNRKREKRLEFSCVYFSYRGFRSRNG